MKPGQRLLDFLSFVVGPVMLVLGLFSFTPKSVLGDNSIAIAYSYEETALLLIAAGTALIAFGLLRKRWASEKM